MVPHKTAKVATLAGCAAAAAAAAAATIQNKEQLPTEPAAYRVSTMSAVFRATSSLLRAYRHGRHYHGTSAPTMREQQDAGLANTQSSQWPPVVQANYNNTRQSHHARAHACVATHLFWLLLVVVVLLPLLSFVCFVPQPPGTYSVQTRFTGTLRTHHRPGFCRGLCWGRGGGGAAGRALSAASHRLVNG